jgi:uncharacterized protein YozE (UPF0346 family)
MYKPSFIYQILAKLIQARDKTLHSEICNLVQSIWNKKEFPQQWEGCVILSTYQKGDYID